jgi:hypothetical protein
MKRPDLKLGAACLFGVILTVSAAAAPKKEKTPQPTKPTEITVFWPKPAIENELLRALRSAIDVNVDGQKIGDVNVGKPLMVTVSPGSHKIKIGHGGLLGIELARNETPVTLAPGTRSYFYIYNSIQGLRAHEVDAATAEAEISGKVTKSTGNRNCPNLLAGQLARA